jgi:hypothetical protein
VFSLCCALSPVESCSPPKLVELTPHVRRGFVKCKRRNGEMRKGLAACGNRPVKIPERMSRELLDEESFAKLVASDKRFRRAVPGEEILDFAVLIDALRWAKDRTGNHLQAI